MARHHSDRLVYKFLTLKSIIFFFVPLRYLEFTTICGKREAEEEEEEEESSTQYYSGNAQVFGTFAYIIVNNRDRGCR